MKESNKERKQIKIIKAKSDTKEQQKYHELNLFSLELGVHFYITLLNTYKHLKNGLINNDGIPFWVFNR